MPNVHYKPYFYRHEGLVHCSPYGNMTTACGIWMRTGVLSHKRNLMVSCLACLVATFR